MEILNVRQGSRSLWFFLPLPGFKKLHHLGLCLSTHVQVKTRGNDTSETGRCVTKDALTCFAANWPISFPTMSEHLNARRTARAQRDPTRLSCRSKSVSMFCPGQPRGARRGDAAGSGWGLQGSGISAHLDQSSLPPAALQSWDILLRFTFLSCSVPLPAQSSEGNSHHHSLLLICIKSHS